MSNTPSHPERVLELQAAESIGDLTHQEAAELAALRRNGVDGSAAAAVVGGLLVASTAGAERPLSGALRASIIAQGQAAVGVKPPVSAGERKRRPLIGPVGWAGWIAAAVATVSFVWQISSQAPAVQEERLEQVLAAPQTVRLALNPPAGGRDDYGGEVLWNASGQDGFLVAPHLPVNDPAASQYQLWIVDAGRPENARWVDCGVFNSDAGVEFEGVRYIYFHAKLSVKQAERVALAVEPSGGVVLAIADHVVATASVPLARKTGDGPFDSTHWPPR